ncbi:hypothetical protein ACHWQZ_G018880 [Mnemiopsis leidyi]
MGQKPPTFLLVALLVTTSEGEVLFHLVNRYGTTVSAPGSEVLVLYKGGTVCDTNDHFDDNSAHAICRLMGYEKSNSWSSGFKRSMQNSYPITLDNVACGSSGLWSSCSYDFGVSDCSHYNDVYLNCKRYCEATYYFDQGQGCRQCSEGTYSSGGTTSSCSNCPTGKTVAAGSGTSQSDCTWVPCLAAHYLDQIQGCRQCSEGTYSSGGTSSSCSNCPTGKTVAAGSGTSESDCTWIPCTGGHFLNTQTGCQDCPEHHFSLGGILTSCVSCPEGRGALPGTAAIEEQCIIPLGLESLVKSNAE